MFLGNMRNISCIRYMYPSLATLDDMSTAYNVATTAQIQPESDSRITTTDKIAAEEVKVSQKKVSLKERNQSIYQSLFIYIYPRKISSDIFLKILNILATLITILITNWS